MSKKQVEAEVEVKPLLAPDRGLPKPTVGRIVHFVLAKGQNAGSHRAAIITGVLEGKPNLTISYDHIADHADDTRPFFISEGRVEGAEYDENHLPGTWHWPERE